MASRSNNKRPKKHPSLPIAIRFFKIILHNHGNSINIPNKFTKKYGGGLSNPMFLKPPDGSEWKVYWTKHDGEFSFEEGWKEFATNYSLGYGHLVVFEYKRNSDYFEVNIFDTSTVEIDYPSQDKDTGDDSIEILNEPPPCRKKRMKSERDDERSPNAQNLLPQPVRTKGGQSEGRNFEMPIIASIKEELDGGNGSKRTSVLISPRAGTTRAIKETKKFTTENPFFMINIKPVHLRRAAAGVPGVFIRKYFNENKLNVMIQFEKKLWHLKLLYYPLKCVAMVSVGWSLFVKESKLEAGDICIFELINREDAVFDVHIFKGHV